MADIKAETIALSALFQACQQINRVAFTGFYDETAVATLLRAMLVTDPKTVEDIYNPAELVLGFRQLVESFGQANTERTMQTIELTKNALKIVSFEINIERNAKLFNRMGSEIDNVKTRVLERTPDFMEGNVQEILTADNIKDFASVYQNVISPNFAKLIIYGEERFLREIANQDKIRALLLSALRAVVLWRQVGGRRRFLIFRRKKIIECAKHGVLNGNLN